MKKASELIEARISECDGEYRCADCGSYNVEYVGDSLDSDDDFENEYDLDGPYVDDDSFEDEPDYDSGPVSYDTYDDLTSTDAYGEPEDYNSYYGESAHVSANELIERRLREGMDTKDARKLAREMKVLKMTKIPDKDESEYEFKSEDTAKKFADKVGGSEPKKKGMNWVVVG